MRFSRLLLAFEALAGFGQSAIEGVASLPARLFLVSRSRLRSRRPARS
jgi:hypothetical protein